MLWVIIGLCIPAAFGVFNFGLYALVLILLSIATTVITEYVYEKLMHKPNTIGDLSAVVTGLLIGLNIPSTAPFWLPIIGGIFAIVVVKELFGGLGQNFMNPALGARCFLVISFPRLMTDFVTDTYTGATPLAALKAGEEVDVMKMIEGFTGGVIGETSMIAIVIGACVLIMAGVIDLRIPGSYIVSFGLFVIIFGGRGWDPA
jgi:electron transport complex protein RnfD/electron transport complex protein RnfC